MYRPLEPKKVTQVTLCYPLDRTAKIIVTHTGKGDQDHTLDPKIAFTSSNMLRA